MPPRRGLKHGFSSMQMFFSSIDPSSYVLVSSRARVAGIVVSISKEEANWQLSDGI